MKTTVPALQPQSNPVPAQLAQPSVKKKPRPMYLWIRSKRH